ncbi:MAG: YqgE/AlgH family protein [Spirochaetia bacterium]|nr:YqgE/AlgH family protein [Spirochaetia bacterium]
MPGPESLKGKFLISEANMSDPNFFQTVVLMVEHNDEGAFGIVVNRRSKLTLADILPGFTNERGAMSPIYVGGPVQQEYLFVLHSELPDMQESEHRSSPVAGVYFEPAFRRLESFFQDEEWNKIPADDRPRLHLFLGYSGWAPGQLEREMERGSWITHPASAKIVFHENPEEGWKNALRDKGGIYRVFADTDPDPGLN